MKQVGYLLLGGGAILQVSESMAKASVNSAQGNATFDQTPFGKIVAPIDSFLPVPLGWTLIILGAVIVWVLPHIGGGHA